ncbi:MAG: hypothetical protein ACLQIH_14205 [Myxococcaceae bacterium]
MCLFDAFSREQSRGSPAKVMRLYPTAVPVISRDILKLLMLDGDVEVEPMRIVDAEADLTAIMREYLTNEDRVNQATREVLERRGPGQRAAAQASRLSLGAVPPRVVEERMSLDHCPRQDFCKGPSVPGIVVGCDASKAFEERLHEVAYLFVTFVATGNIG